MIMRTTITSLEKMKLSDQKITMLTCYDASFASLIDKTGVNCILVGDSLGNTMMGYSSTIPVTVDDMIRYGASVVRKTTNAFVVVDMPYLSYHISTEDAVRNAGKIIQETGAGAVKLEGGEEFADTIKAITRAQIPVVAHLGLTPQSVNAFGGYSVQAKTKDAVVKLLADAHAVEDAGARMLVIEGVPGMIGDLLSRELKIPVIGIGAGIADGQVLVLQDMLGMNEDVPKFVKKYANLAQIVVDAIITYDTEVKQSAFPASEHTYNTDPALIEEISRLY